MTIQDKEREAFEQLADSQGWPPRGTAWRREGYVIWQAARQAAPMSEPVREMTVEEMKLELSNRYYYDPKKFSRVAHHLTTLGTIKVVGEKK